VRGGSRGWGSKGTGVGAGGVGKQNGKGPWGGRWKGGCGAGMFS